MPVALPSSGHVDVERCDHFPKQLRLTTRARRVLFQLVVGTALVSAAWWFVIVVRDGRGIDWGGLRYTAHTQSIPGPLAPLSDPLQAWGIVEPSPATLLRNLTPWPSRSADAGIYDYGPPSDAYASTLHEYARTWPPALRDKLEHGLVRYLGEPGDGDMGRVGKYRRPAFDPELGLAEWDAPPTEAEAAVPPEMEGEGPPPPLHRSVWQTDRHRGVAGGHLVQSWVGRAGREGWGNRLLSDDDADEFVAGLADGEENVVQYLWRSMPRPVMKADLLRYLLLLVHGGIYSDTDTRLLKAPSKWGAGATLWRGGEGWLADADRRRIEAGESIDDVLGRPAVVVGIEVDVQDRDDWRDWWPRPLQIVQWTMAMAPYHPIPLSAVLRVTHQTAHAASWAAERWDSLTRSKSSLLARLNEPQPRLHPGDKGESDNHAEDSPQQADPEAEARRNEAIAKALGDTTAVSEPRHGGPLGVMEWTGPGIWTDAVVTYLRNRWGCEWTELRDMRRPMRVGDVVVLPITGFSPGIGQFGAGEISDDEAMVQHMFRGSWKDKSWKGK